MLDGAHPEEFPDINQKLSAPKKLSAFEKERQAQAAKQQRAEAENAAALKEFEDSFARETEDDDDPNEFDAHALSSGGPPRGPRGGFGRSGRYGPRGRPDMAAPPPPSLKRKRALDEMREHQEALREHEELMQDCGESPQPASKDREGKDDGSSRPTIQLASLPPNATTDDIKVLLRDHLKVHSVRIGPSDGQSPNSKRSSTAIATLTSDVSNAQIDSSITALKEQYLGCGFYLTIARHLSSTALHPAMALSSSAVSTEPFGAEKPPDDRSRLRNAMPFRDHRGFAPPESCSSTAPTSFGSGLPRDIPIVHVHPPLTIEAIKAVHTVADHLLLEQDLERALETEAMLMSLPDVQRDERFAFLYDSRSAAGIYYRFLLWGPERREDERTAERGENRTEKIFQDAPLDWLAPYSQVPFLELKSLGDVIENIDYDSSGEESDDDEERDKADENISALQNSEKKLLTPLKRARLTYLLSRLPTSNARLRKGDVARVTNFSINNAGQGAEEIVDMLLLNVEKPFSYSLAAKYEEIAPDQDDEQYDPEVAHNYLNPSASDLVREARNVADDPANAKLVALYVLSDIFSASSTAGARNAWKYRQLFEAGFRAQKTFEHLGRLDKEFQWGRLKAEQWKRKIDTVLGIWESWSVFSTEVQGELRRSFFEPPLSDEEQAKVAAEERKRLEERRLDKIKSVENTASTPALDPMDGGRTRGSPEKSQSGPVGTAIDASCPGNAQDQSRNHVESPPLDDASRMAARKAFRVDRPQSPQLVQHGPTSSQSREQRIDNRKSSVQDTVNAETRPNEAEKAGFAVPMTTLSGASRKPTGPRRRPRAEDMFALTDEE